MTEYYRLDEETGESVLYTINDETGEHQPQTTARRSQPVSRPKKAKKNKTSNLFVESKFSLNKQQYSRNKESILKGYNLLSERLLLIPITMIFPSVVSVLLALVEVIFHIICHKKNSQLEDSNLYYRSPLHIITCQFCASCRAAYVADQVSKMQDKTNMRYTMYARGIIA